MNIQLHDKQPGGQEKLFPSAQFDLFSSRSNSSAPQYQSTKMLARASAVLLLLLAAIAAVAIPLVAARVKKLFLPQ